MGRPNGQTLSLHVSFSISAELEHARGRRPANSRLREAGGEATLLFLASCAIERHVVDFCVFPAYPRERMLSVGKAVSKRVPAQLEWSVAELRRAASLGLPFSSDIFYTVT